MPYCTPSLDLAAPLDSEAVPLHAQLVLLDHALAVLLRVVALGEQHALVAPGLLVLAHAAGL